MMMFLPRSRASDAAPDPTPALLARLAAGDMDALDALYRREAGSVYRYVLALAGNPAWAADAMHDAFIALAQRPDGFDAARGSLGAYLAGIARHGLSRRWREARGMVADAADAADVADDQAAAEAGSTETLAAAPSPEALLIRRQDEAALWAALRAVPLAFREAVVLVDLQERPYAEAARIAQVEINTLRTRLHRGRLRLATLLGAAPAAADAGSAASAREGSVRWTRS